MGINVRDRNITIINISQANTVNVNVAPPRSVSVKSDIDTAGRHIVGQVVSIEPPNRLVGQDTVTSQQCCGLTMRNQIKEGVPTIYGNLHSGTL